MTRTLLRAQTAGLTVFALILSLNIGGISEASAASAVPQSPRNVTAIPGMISPYRSIVVSWQAPANTSMITGYQALAGGKSCKTLIKKPLTCAISGLPGGIPVFASVRSLTSQLKVQSGLTKAGVATTPYA